MPLQIRRGPTADRLAIRPLVGELVYDTTTGAVFVGNGTTLGGVPVTSFSVADSKDATAELFLGLSFTDNTQHNGISFQYIGGRLQATVAQNLSNYQGLISADQGFKGSVWAEDSGIIIEADTHTVYGKFVAQGTILPDTNIAYDIGSSTKRFRDLYLSGSSIYLGNAVLTSTGTALDLPLGTTLAGGPIGFDENSTYGITISGNVIGRDSTVLVNTTNGTFSGDLRGSVFADDSTMLVDGQSGVLRGSLIGNASTATLAATATVASTISLVATDGSSAIHYINFSSAASGSEAIRTDTSLTYQPSSNTLGLSTLNASTINASNLTANIFTNLIRSADSSGIVVTPSITFNSDVTIDNELITTGNIFPTISEQSSIGTFTKKYGKLYLAESANALWIGNVAIGVSGSTLNLPAGSTVGGSIITTAAGSNASTITVNTTVTSADHYISFFDSLSGDKLIKLNSNIKFNPGSNRLTVDNATIGTVTGNLIGIVTGTLIGNSFGYHSGDMKGSVFGDDSTKLVDGVEGKFFGALTGNVTGTLTGNVITTSILSTQGQIKAVSTSEANVPFRSENYTNTSNSVVNWSWFRSRGTTTVPVAVQSGDNIGRFNFSAWNGTAEQNVARIQVEAGNTTTTGNSTGSIRFLTTDQFGTFGTALLISAERNVTLATGDLTVTAGTIVSGEGFQTGSLRIFDNKITTTVTNADLELDPSGTGTVDFVVSQQTTVGAAGVASPLPVTPSLYFTIKVNGTSYVVPAYAVS